MKWISKVSHNENICICLLEFSRTTKMYKNPKLSLYHNHLLKPDQTGNSKLFKRETKNSFNILIKLLSKKILLSGEVSNCDFHQRLVNRVGN